MLDELDESLVVNERHLAKYRRDAGVLRDELTYLHADLRLLGQLEAFPAGLFEAPPALLAVLAHNLTTECVHICFRVWIDTRRSVLTLKRLSQWLTEYGIRPEFRPELDNRLATAAPSSRVEEVLEGFRSVRHCVLAHLDANVIGGLKSPPQPVAGSDLQDAARALGYYYNAMSFGAEQFFVPVQFYSRDDSWWGGDLGYVLDRIALGSKWFTAPRDHPEFFRRTLRPGLSDSDLAEINAVRERHRLEPLA